MRILFVGDVHGDTANARHLFRVAEKQSCEAIVVVGDFGYWEHSDDGPRFLAVVSRTAGQAGIALWFVDGNHENHTLLRERYVGDRVGSVEIRPDLHYLVRGARWTWDGVTFLALGGAASHDREYRLAKERARKKAHQRERWLWWPEEVITEQEAARATAGGPVDVMVTHDAPASVLVPEVAMEHRRFPEADRNRALLARVVDATRPRLLVHGHYHHRYRAVVELDPEAGGRTSRLVVEGLDCDGSGADQWIVVDTEDLRRGA